jgi:hypothetical protein
MYKIHEKTPIWEEGMEGPFVLSLYVCVFQK